MTFRDQSVVEAPATRDLLLLWVKADDGDTWIEETVDLACADGESIGCSRADAHHRAAEYKGQVAELRVCVSPSRTSQTSRLSMWRCCPMPELSVDATKLVCRACPECGAPDGYPAAGPCSAHEAMERAWRQLHDYPLSGRVGDERDAIAMFKAGLAHGPAEPERGFTREEMIAVVDEIVCQFPPDAAAPLLRDRVDAAIEKVVGVPVRAHPEGEEGWDLDHPERTAAQAGFDSATPESKGVHPAPVPSVENWKIGLSPGEIAPTCNCCKCHPQGLRVGSGTVEIAYCPEHGLHGQRDTCFECGKPVVQIAMKPVGVEEGRRVTVTIDRKPYTFVTNSTVLPDELRAAAGVPDGYDLWMERREGDEKVVARPIHGPDGRKFYTAPKHINAGSVPSVKKRKPRPFVRCANCPGDGTDMSCAVCRVGSAARQTGDGA